MRAQLRQLIENSVFQNAIVGVIVINAVILGLQTSTMFSQDQLEFLGLLDNVCLVIFCVELALKLITYQFRFFKDGWNVFDFLVIGIALAPATGGLSVLRALRVLRLMRLVTVLPAMRRVISGMFNAIPGAASVAGVLSIMYYVAAVMGTTLFRDSNPELFGTLGTSLFTLFKMMTLEGWPDIADAVLANKPNAWPFFVLFIIFTTFTTLNLLFGIIVGAMEQAKEDEARARMAEQGLDVPTETNEMRLAQIETEVKQMRQLLTAVYGDKAAGLNLRLAEKADAD